MMTLINTATEMMYLAIFDNSSGKEKPHLLNGGTTLWDTQTEEIADEICAGCDTDAEKVQAIYGWMVANLDYDYDYHVLFQYFNVRKTLHTKKGVCFDLSHLFAAVKTFLAIPLTEYPMRTAPFSTPGTVCTMTVLGGTWM